MENFESLLIIRNISVFQLSFKQTKTFLLASKYVKIKNNNKALQLQIGIRFSSFEEVIRILPFSI